VLALAVAAAAGISAYAAVQHLNPAQPGGPRPSGIPASVSTSLANLMALDPLPGRPAPGFRFTDQTGRALSLSAFRGKIVVLEFMDPHCTDICPIVSQEFLDAYRDLGPAAGQVVFAAVNVNQYYSSVPAVAKFSAEQRLGTIPSWHFFTGPTPALQTTWRDYNIEVQAPNPNADIVHTSAIYFIDAQGRERYLASPEVDHAGDGTSYLPAGQISGWGQGIAALARALAR
jgi:cytochrome oxidase Cu insertion factor (SCO1/SenC/PrrC family)